MINNNRALKRAIVAPMKNLKENHFDKTINLPEKNHVRCASKKMTTQVATADKNDTVGEALEWIKKNIFELKDIDYIYVLDKDLHTIGVISFKDLLRHPKNTKIEAIMQKNLVFVSPDTDQEKVADLAVKHDIKSIPIVQNRKLIGVVPIEEILPILNKALREDILHLAGIHKAHLNYENTLAVPLIKGVFHRIPYLLIGLVGIILAAMFISAFEATLQKYITLAFFIPAIVYMSDALGTQHQTLFVRDLALLGNELNLRIYFLRQMIIGSLMALLISGVIFAAINLFWVQPLMAIIISTAMFVTLVFTSFTSLTITLCIKRLKLDPALGSGPVATIISDVSSIIVYFLIASIFLGGM